MKIMTKAFYDATFFIAYTEDKKEGVYVKPLSDTDVANLRNEAAKEAGADEAVGNGILTRKMIQAALVDWKGFCDVTGAEIPCDKDTIADICEHDPEIANGLVFRIRNVARMGEMEEQKN